MNCFYDQVLKMCVCIDSNEIIIASIDFINKLNV